MKKQHATIVEKVREAHNLSSTSDALHLIVRKVQYGLYDELEVLVTDVIDTKKEASRFQREVTSFSPKRSNSGKSYYQQGNNT